MLSILLAAAALSPPVALDQRPAWSPDGTRIAFIRVTGRRSYLEVIRADGRGPRRLSPKVADLTPAWSPDSRSIAFSRVILILSCFVTLFLEKTGIA